MQALHICTKQWKVNQNLITNYKQLKKQTSFQVILLVFIGVRLYRLVYTHLYVLKQITICYCDETDAYWLIQKGSFAVPLTNLMYHLKYATHRKTAQMTSFHWVSTLLLCLG